MAGDCANAITGHRPTHAARTENHAGALARRDGRFARRRKSAENKDRQGQSDGRPLEVPGIPALGILR